MIENVFSYSESLTNLLHFLLRSYLGTGKCYRGLSIHQSKAIYKLKTLTRQSKHLLTLHKEIMITLRLHSIYVEHMSISMPVILYIYPWHLISFYLFIYLSFYAFIYSFIHSFIYIFTSIYTCTFIYFSINVKCMLKI
jgi:hypothetical protein